MRMKNGFLIFSGFLGSGKTSMMITLSKELEARGLPARYDLERSRCARFC